MEIVELGELVLREGFGGEEIEGTSVGIFQNGIDDGQVVAERLTGGGRGNDDDVLAGVSGFGGCGLVGVGSGDAFRTVNLAERGLNPLRPVGVLGDAGRKVADSGENFMVVVAFGKVGKDLVDFGDAGFGATLCKIVAYRLEPGTDGQTF